MYRVFISKVTPVTNLTPVENLPPVKWMAANRFEQIVLALAMRTMGSEELARIVGVGASKDLRRRYAFPLAVHLDALFDQGLITFADDGSMLLSPRLSSAAIALYNLSADLHLRCQLTDKQRTYLAYHRQHVYRSEV